MIWVHIRSKEKRATKRLAGLKDINDLEQVRPEELRHDKGSAFPGVLMSKFKNYKQTCALVREAQKEQHGVTEFLAAHPD